MSKTIIYKCEKGTSNAFIGAPCVANAWNSHDAEQASRKFTEKMGSDYIQVCQTHYLQLDYHENTVAGSAVSTNTASALKCLANNARALHDYDKTVRLRPISSRVAAVSDNGMRIVSSAKQSMRSVSSLEEFLYAGNKIDGIAVANSETDLRRESALGHLPAYDRRATYIIIPPSALSDSVQEVRLAQVSQEIPVIYDVREKECCEKESPRDCNNLYDRFQSAIAA